MRQLFSSDKQKLVALVQSRKSSDDEDGELFAPVVATCKSHSSDIVECQGTATALKRAVAEGGVETHTVFRPLLFLPVVICLSPAWLSAVSVLISFQSSSSCCAPDHTSNALALAQGCAEKRAHVYPLLSKTSQHGSGASV